MKIFDWLKATPGAIKNLLKRIYIKPVAAPAVAETKSNEVKPVNKITLAILQNSQPADGRSAITLQANVTDENNAAVAGAVVNFSVTAGTLAPAQVITDANGQAVASITSTVAGPLTLTAILADGTTASVSTLAFVAVVPTTGGGAVSGTGVVSGGGGVLPGGSVGSGGGNGGVIPVAAQPAAPATDDILAHVKDLLTLAGHDVEYVWDEVVAFAKKLA